jgi:hypothetical protein
MRKALLTIAIILMWATCTVQAQSQIIDDSTQMVYGPFSTFFLTVGDIKYNRYNLRNIDTLVTGFHQFNYVNDAENMYQDLGNIGTAIRPVFYQPPSVIGAQSGFDAYRFYYTEAEEIELYDTKSPYTLLNVALGGGGRSLTNVKHSRNITPYWNAGFHFRRMTAEKQVNSTGRGDRQTVSTAYHLHTHYRSPNDKYTGIFTLSRLNHEVEENGGLTVPEGEPLSAYFTDFVSTNLEDAESQDFRLEIQAYNEYKVRPEFQLYHQMRFVQNKYFYRDESLTSADFEYYRRVLINPDSTQNQSRFNRFVNEFGLKGDYTKFFYNFYGRFRTWNYTNRYLPGKENAFESYGGYNLRFDFDSLQYLQTSGEYLLGGYYRIGGDYTMNFLKAQYWRTRSQPDIIQQSHFGNHHEWQNDFQPVVSDHIKGGIIVRWKGMRFYPYITLDRVSNYIYYDYDQTPAQSGDVAALWRPGVALDFTLLQNFHFRNEFIYTVKSGSADAVNPFRIPEYFANSRIFYGNRLFNGAIYIEAGVDMHYKSAFRALAYDPAIQQFHLQDDFRIPAYLLADFFLDFQIDHVTVFLKLTHGNQSAGDGYFTFPYYTGQSRVFDAGVRWMFFN